MKGTKKERQYIEKGTCGLEVYQVYQIGYEFLKCGINLPSFHRVNGKAKKKKTE